MAIFVSIASYRDPQLAPTIADCLAKARYPGDLRFGVCWQHGPEEAELPYWRDGRFRILDVDWRASQGACWARAEIMKLWQGEEYFLQLDSHHRFVQDWDVKLLGQLERSGSAKPLLSAYAAPFTPGDPDLLDTEALQMNFDRFTEDGIALFRPGAIPNWRELDHPVRARFLSAHFLFTISDFVREVPYDPELYFLGEEISLAVRAYTHGYDLFHPSEIIVWHEYTRSYRTKHWDDHIADNDVDRDWQDRDTESREKVRRFLANPWVGQFGCGSDRTFAEYESYAGVSFECRRVQDYTRQGQEPPNPPAATDWAARIRTYQLDIAIDPTTLPVAARDAPLFWYVGFHDADGREVYRQDADEQELDGLLAEGATSLRLKREFESDQQPVSWTVWPFSRADGWLQRIEGTVDAIPAPVTLVTALLDLGRGQLDGPFARSFETNDLPLFERLLTIDLPMVIYLDPRHAEIVWRHRRPENTRIVPLQPEDLHSFPYFQAVQEIRSRSDWLRQAGWLPHSPQAMLEYYNPLVMSKLRWLGEQARARPFATERLFWIDAGLCRTVHYGLLCDPILPERLIKAAKDFLFVAFPYVGPAEIHGFPREVLARLAGVREVDRVARGGFFGGTIEAVAEAADLYENLLETTLSAGFMGTEESVFTILSYRHPERMKCFMVADNGLIGPFFEALVEDRAEQLLLEPSPPPEQVPATEPVVPASPAHRWPPGILAEDPEVARVGYTTFLGLQMMQNRNAVFAFEALGRHLQATGIHIARIIELGTSSGGLSVLLQIHCLTHGADFITYDSNDGVGYTELFERLGIDRRVRDTTHEFVINEIVEEIQKPGITLLLCDGPSKRHEVDTFSDFLKPGDLIMAHDYARSRAIFEEQIHGSLWSWCEITDDDVRDAIERNQLEPLLPEVLETAVWGGWLKRSEQVRRVRGADVPVSTVAVYVLTFNAPEQFRIWLESVELAVPELLAGRSKVLLNNSTDATTFDAYDDLCQRYGFTQYRPGNIGINGGRIWCARHFDQDIDCDIMLYFEDDMLLHTSDGLCPNGFPTHVAELLERAAAIVKNEDLDFLKLSFTEFHGDHTRNWAYVNCSESDRATYFPSGPATRVDAIKSYGGVSYIVGDIHYSNWPMLITRRGNRTIFLDSADLPEYEQLLMVHVLKLMRAGKLRAGVLLASTVNHHRVVHYPAEERKEC